VTSWEILVRIGCIALLQAQRWFGLSAVGRKSKPPDLRLVLSSFVAGNPSWQVSADRFGTAVSVWFFLLQLLIIEAVFVQRPSPNSRIASAFALSLTFACIKVKFSITHIFLNSQSTTTREAGGLNLQ
jgi:hypothetical protein